ncbi:MAG: hypothetical protein WBZ07_03205 [Candidatus Dormiibacterota bacterium]
MNWAIGWFCWWWLIFFLAGLLGGLFSGRRYWLQRHRKLVERDRRPRPSAGPAPLQ